MTPVEFLTARWDEFERWAKACAEVYPPPWEVSDRGWMARVVADGPNFLDVARLEEPQAAGRAWLGDFLQHIAATDPAYVLADIAAKRAILALHAPIESYEWNPLGHCKECSDSGWEGAVDGARPVDYPCPTARILMQPFADHPDYQREWAL